MGSDVAPETLTLVTPESKGTDGTVLARGGAGKHQGQMAGTAMGAVETNTRLRSAVKVAADTQGTASFSLGNRTRNHARIKPRNHNRLWVRGALCDGPHDVVYYSFEHNLRCRAQRGIRISSSRLFSTTLHFREQAHGQVPFANCHEAH